MKNQKNRSNVFLMILAAVLMLAFYGCSTGHDGDEIVREELVVKGTTTSYATDKGTIIFVSSSNPQVIVEAKEEETFPSGAAVVLVERAMYASEAGVYGSDATNIYCLSGTYSENGVEKKLTEIDKSVTLTIPNNFSSEYYEFILAFKPLDTADWQYTKLGDDGKAVVASARCGLARPSQFIIATRHIGYCYTVFGVKPDSRKLDAINSITFVADPEKYVITDNNEYTENLRLSSIVEAEKTTSMFAASDLTSELTFYTSSSLKTGILIDGKTASESVSVEKQFNGLYLHRISINRYEEQNFSKSGNLATYSVVLGIKGISKSVFPPEFHIKSTVITESRVVFAGEGKITRRVEEKDDPVGSPIDVAMTVPASDIAASISTQIVLNFSEAINWSANEEKLISICNEQKVNISFSATISDDLKVLTIKPDKLLDYNSLHEVDIEAGIKGNGTFNYVKPASFTFSTEAGVNAKAVIKPGAGSKVNDCYVKKPEFIINFGKSVAVVGEVKNSISVLREGEVIDYNITFTDSSNRIASLTFPSELMAGKSYSISMTSRIKDTEDLDIIEFEPVNLLIFPNIELVGVTPENDAINVAADTTIDFRLSAPITWNSSEAKNLFSLKDAETGADIPFDVTFDGTNNVISLKPQIILFYNRKYEFSMKAGFRNEITKQELGGYSSSFITADSSYTVAELNSVEGYHQKTVLPFIVFLDNPKMEVDFKRDLMDYNLASETIVIQKNGVNATDWHREWNGNKLILTPPNNQLEKGARYRIAMSDALKASDNSLINPFIPQEFIVALLHGKGRPDNPYQIYNTDDFEVMREYLSSCFVLMDDIDFNGISDYEPIGNESGFFYGSLYGNGKTIKNLTLEPPEDTKLIGIFGVICNSEIASLTIDESCGYIQKTSYDLIYDEPGEYQMGSIAARAVLSKFINCENNAEIKGCDVFGGIAGENTDTIFENCTNKGRLYFNGSRSHNVFIGGIAGRVVRGAFKGCTNTSDFDMDISSIAGIVGQFENGEMTDCHNEGDITGNAGMAGGIAAGALSAKISGCKNSGSINGVVDASGIACYVEGSSFIEKCHNSGQITCANYDYTVGWQSAGIVSGLNGNSVVSECFNEGQVTGRICVAGIVGSARDGSSIKNCYSIADISGAALVGGVVGSAECYNYGFIDNCYCIGDIKAYGSAGGIAGSLYMVTATNCFYQGNVIKENIGCYIDYSCNDNSCLSAIADNELEDNFLLVKNCFSTTATTVMGTPLTTSSSLGANSAGYGTFENNFVFDVDELTTQGYDTVIKGAAWGSDATWNDETVWKHYSDRLPELVRE